MVEALNNFRLFLLQTQSNWFVDSASPWYIYIQRLRACG